MNRIGILLCFLILGCMSCKNTKKEIDKLELAKRYYEALDTSDRMEMAKLLTDSLLTRETEYDYEQTFSQEEYLEWLKWDSVFGPAYEILDIGEEKGFVKASVSKVDKRILFLHEEPIVTRQHIHFKEDKIITVETTKYEVFKDSIFVKNRTEFLQWINENHPELNGVIYDQTKAGGLKYLKAMQLFEDRN
ncbi:hypothetical protein [Spongiimicrobium salis]|uniref:hypothetical protein n=1 Tax=Spongiimicrobium salis TaxID=1667022 RepID=UPI00374D172C